MTHRPPSGAPFERYAAALRRLPAAERSAPIGLLDLDAFHANAAALVDRAGGLPVRVASKSLRIRRAVDAALALDGFAGVLAFALPEAIWLARHGASDVVVAYPTVDEAALVEWAADPALRAAVTVTVDSPDHLALVARAADQAGAADDDALPPLRLCLDVDAAWEPYAALRVGALRSPVRTPEQAAAMARRVVAAPGVRLVGVLAYEGQVAGLPEGSGPRAALVSVIKHGSMRDLGTRRPAVVAAVEDVLRAAGAPALEFVNGGGTGSADLTAADPSVTEIGAGSGLLGPASFDGFRHLHLRPASFFMRPVVRRPRAGVVTVAGGGWAASGVPGPDRAPVVAWPEGLRYSPQEGAGEVQTPLRGRAADTLSLGDPVFFRHAKAGEPAEHLTAVAVYSAEQDEIVDLWPTYRGEGKAFG